MKEFTLFCVLTFIFTYTAGQFGLWDDFKKQAKHVHNYEYKALALGKEVRLLKIENQKLKAQLKKAKDDLNNVSFRTQQRTIASIPKTRANDLVEFETFRWSAEKLLGVGEKSLFFGKKSFDNKEFSRSKKHYEKSAQYYHALITHYANHKVVNDKVLFEAGIAAYESKNHYDWSKKHFKNIVKNYPTSTYRIKAQMWLALSHFYLGERDEFIAIVDEFNKNYSNSSEYVKALAPYYDEIDYKYNR